MKKGSENYFKERLHFKVCCPYLLGFILDFFFHKSGVYTFNLWTLPRCFLLYQ